MPHSYPSRLMPLSESEIIADPGYPGWHSGQAVGPRMHTVTRPLGRELENSFWILEYRWSYGIRPLGFTVVDDAMNWGLQRGAYETHLPGSNGQDYALAGIHAYCRELPQLSALEDESREQQLDAFLPPFLEGFEESWAATTQALDARGRTLCERDLSGLDIPELLAYLEDARLYLRWVWEVHFHWMYPLLVNYLGFTGFCEELGIAASEVPKFLAGHPSKITEGDQALFNLAAEARSAGLEATFKENEAGAIVAALGKAGSAGSGFQAKLDKFLQTWGWRTENVGDLGIASWREDPTPVLGMIRTLLAKDEIPNVATELRHSAAARDEAISEARSRLSRSEQESFDEGLQALQSANFIWWNEDHNHYIDMRSTIPMRRAALALGEAFGCAHPDDTTFLFWPELLAVAEGGSKLGEFTNLIGERRDYFAQWAARRGEMPKYLGPTPEEVTDPIMIEMDGVTEEFLRVIGSNQSGAESLTGTAGGPGKTQGRAKILLTAEGIHELAPGDVLVCEGTSPSWTPAFAKIAACVCDTGGSLSHAAVISREYGVPSVLGTAIATKLIREGDLVEVDGTKGEVRVLERAA